MYEVYLRLKSVKTNQIMEVCFDSRLSFRENLGILSKIKKISIDTFYVYDENIGVFIKTDVPLSDMKIKRFNMFDIL